MQIGHSHRRRDMGMLEEQAPGQSWGRKGEHAPSVQEGSLEEVRSELRLGERA